MRRQCVPTLRPLLRPHSQIFFQWLTVIFKFFAKLKSKTFHLHEDIRKEVHLTCGQKAFAIGACQQLKTPLIPSALQQSVLGV